LFLSLSHRVRSKNSSHAPLWNSSRPRIELREQRTGLDAWVGVPRPALSIKVLLMQGVSDDFRSGRLPEQSQLSSPRGLSHLKKHEAEPSETLLLPSSRIVLRPHPLPAEKKQAKMPACLFILSVVDTPSLNGVPAQPQEAPCAEAFVHDPAVDGLSVNSAHGESCCRSILSSPSPRSHA